MIYFVIAEKIAIGAGVIYQGRLCQEGLKVLDNFTSWKDKNFQFIFAYIYDSKYLMKFEIISYVLINS